MEEQMMEAGVGTPESGEKKSFKLPKIRKKRRWVRLLAILLVLVLVGWGAIRFLAGGQGQAAPQYDTAQALRRDVAVRVDGTATLQPMDSYNVTALVSGEILSAPFEELDTVSQGDLLYEIDASSARNSVSSAAISVQQAQMAYDQARAATTPVSPISGTVTEVYAKNGDAVHAGDKLAKVVESMDIVADFRFSYVSPSSFYAGQSATVFITGCEGSVQGTVVSVSDSTAVASDGRVSCTVRVKITNPGTLTDSAGYTAQAVIGSYTSARNATLSLGGSAVITAEGSGTVSNFSKLAGSTVAAGEALCTISSAALEDQIQSARLSLESARLTQSTAQDSMDGYRITAPISGTVIEKNYKAGDKVDGVSSGTLAVVYDLSALKMEMNVNELDIGKVQVGQTVEVTADALPGEVFTGRVEKVSIAGTTTGGFTTYPVTITVADYGNLKPGMNVSCSVLGETAQNVLCVPVDAVERGNVVRVAPPEALTDGVLTDVSQIEERTVTLGRSDNGYIEITSGLKEGETVLLQTADSEMGG